MNTKSRWKKLIIWLKNTTYYTLVLRICLLESKMKAMQVIDWSWQDGGKIILLVSINGRDICKIIEVPRHTTLQGYKQMVYDIQRQYGAVATFYDGIHGDDMLKDVIPPLPTNPLQRV